MASRRQRKRRTITIVIICAAIVFGTLMYYGIRDYVQQQDPGYGKIGKLQKDDDEDDLNVIEKDFTGKPLHCVTFDCGDALSVLIDIGDTEVLYDTGYAETGDEISKKIGKYVDGSLDYLILSHSHADHVGGTPAIARDYDIDKVITSGERDGSSGQYVAAEKALKEEGCVIEDDEDATIDLGEGAVLSIIDNLDPEDTENPNDLSVIAHVKYGGSQILITGDAEKDAERSLIGKFHDVSLLVAGHHMSSSSNTALLLQEWSPEYIFVSCKGKDSQYGFPHKAALQRSLDVTSQVYGTFKSGDLIYTTDGSESSVNVDQDKALTMEDIKK